MQREPGSAVDETLARLPESIGVGPSPLWPQNLLDVFVRPSRFFSSQLALGKTPYVLLVTWCYGIASAMDRIDQDMLRAEMGRPRPGWDHLGPLVTESWLGYWGVVGAIGALSACFLWWLGGWWYRKRLGWSGASEPDPMLARLVYVYSSFVWAGPAVLAALATTLVFPSYDAAWSSDESWSLALVIFPFWSLVTSYRGATTLFDVSLGRARLWFVILPGVLYLTIFGVLAVALSFLAAH